MKRDFRCRECLHEFQKDTKALKPKCPKCKSPRTVRLILSAPQVIFRGNGFYVNDSKGK